jgi:hypothetical protein
MIPWLMISRGALVAERARADVIGGATARFEGVSQGSMRTTKGPGGVPPLLSARAGFRGVLLDLTESLPRGRNWAESR